MQYAVASEAKRTKTASRPNRIQCESKNRLFQIPRRSITVDSMLTATVT